MTTFSTRLIIKKEGLEILIKEFKDEKNDSLKNIITKAEFKKEIGDIMYLGWNNMTSQQYFFLQDKVFCIGYDNISYRITGIGENIEDVQEEYYSSSKDEEMNIPFPSVIRTFDDIDVEQQLNCYLKSKEMGPIEYE